MSLLINYLIQTPMRLEKYELEFNSTKTTFEFISVGPKGHILKRIEYSKLKVKGLKNFL